ncbi:phosphotransacetylase [Spiroplasma endosymbiont of Aspidapion aeneum]|uniref:phosphotransacetylase n=1 Tax=Spiroplasma endosymbiont of Aspidapion aeneum TaxID=3066276 RepID=UPI00313CD570
MYSIEEIKNILITQYNNNNKFTIIFPEGEEDKIVSISRTLVDQQLCKGLVFYQKKENIPHDCGKRENLSYVIIEEETELLDKFANQLFEMRKGKVTQEDAKKLVLLPNYFGAMYIYNKMADCMLSGLRTTTADVIRPALQIIKTRSDVGVAASAIIMKSASNEFIFADCSLNLDPIATELVSIAKLNNEFAKFCGIDKPEVALLSYSTFGSGQGASPKKVEEAVEQLSKEKDLYYGPIQFDAAVDKDVRFKKAPKLKALKQSPDVFVFPNLDSGNIGYKILQRMGGFNAFGPFILGLNQPVNDLSRGSTYDDIYGAAIITLYQAYMAQISQKGKK